MTIHPEEINTQVNLIGESSDVNVGNNYDNELYDLENTTKQVKNIISQIIISNKLLLFILFFFTILYLVAYTVSDIKTNKTIIISPAFNTSYGTGYYSFGNEYYQYDTPHIIRPCIYTPSINTHYCCNNYELINTFDICTIQFQESSSICLLNDIIKANPNAYVPNCKSIISLNNLYNNESNVNTIIENTVILDDSYYKINIFVVVVFALTPVIILITFVLYSVFFTSISTNDDIRTLCFYMYKHFALYITFGFIMIIILIGGITLIFNNPSIKFLTEIITINCSHYDIFTSLNFIQKVLVANLLNTPGYENTSVYAKYFEYVSYAAFGEILSFMIISLFIIIQIFRLKIN